MADPISERIAAALATRLALITTGNGYDFDIVGVQRPKKLEDTSQEHLLVSFVQGDEVPNLSISYPGNPPADGRDLPFVISMILTPDETDTDSIDEWRNKGAAAIRKAVTTPADWHNWGGLAVDSRFVDTLEELSEDASESAVKVGLIVSYRTPENDPYTVA